MFGELDARRSARTVTHRFVPIGTALAAAILFGCGGGGGGGDGGDGDPGLTDPPTALVAVTTANATQVGATALEPVLGGSDLLTRIVGIEASAAPAPRVVTRTMRNIAYDAKALLGAPPRVVAVVETLQCLVSGSVTTDGSSDGTSATITYNACSDVAGQTLNGVVSITGFTFNFDDPSQTFSLSGTFGTNVTYAETGSPTLRLVGGFSIGESCNLNTFDCTGSYTGTKLSVSDGTETWMITNFTITESNVSTAITMTASYTVASTVLNGSVAIVTSTPLQMAAGAQYPHAGVIVATGSANTKVRLTVLGSDPTAAAQVRIDVDADGDDSYEISNTYAWSDL